MLIGRTSLAIIAVAAAALAGVAVPLAKDERPIPEFIATSATSDFCDVGVQLQKPNRDAIFGFLDAAYQYTARWRQKFLVVGVDYVHDNSLHIISHKPCSLESEGARFASAFFQTKASQCGQCRVWLYFQPGSLSPYIVRARDVKFLTRRQMFLRYRTSSALKPCAVSFHILPQPVSHTPSANLFMYINNAQYRYRLPVDDAGSGANNEAYILFSRQCSDKRALYEALLAAVERLGGDPTMMKNANYQPGLSVLQNTTPSSMSHP